MTVGQKGWNITNLFIYILLRCDKQYPLSRKYILQVRRILQRRTAEKSQAHPHLFMCDFFCHMFCTKLEQISMSMLFTTMIREWILFTSLRQCQQSCWGPGLLWPGPRGAWASPWCHSKEDQRQGKCCSFWPPVPPSVQRTSCSAGYYCSRFVEAEEEKKLASSLDPQRMSWPFSPK